MGDIAAENVTIAPNTRQLVFREMAASVVRPARRGGANDPAHVSFFVGGAISTEGIMGKEEGAVFRLVTIVGGNPTGYEYRRAVHGRGTIAITKNGDGLGNTAQGTGVRYLYRNYNYCTASAECGRVASTTNQS